MNFQARITVHERGRTKPDYTDIHRRMANIGYMREIFIGGKLLSELHGIYQKTGLSISNIDSEQAAIEQALRMIEFSFSIELFQVSATRTCNLEPAPNYGHLLNLLACR
jgi:hypothetical protein